jgi:hypothetical protein
MRDASTNPTGQVSELQSFLEDYFNLDEGTLVAGVFGRKTQNYLIQFQKKHGLPAFGVAGTLTRAKIAEVCRSGGGTTISGEYGGSQCKQWTDGLTCGTACTRAYAGAQPACYTKACEAYGPADAKPRCTEYFGEKPVACTREYAPVCGKPQCQNWDRTQASTGGDLMTSIGKLLQSPGICDAEQTYSNKCTMNAAGASFVHEGACGARTECLIYNRPLCAEGEELMGGVKMANGCVGAPYCKKRDVSICTMEYAPVCGKPAYCNRSNTAYSRECELGKTYSNKCVMSGEGATYMRQGECGTSTTKCGVNSFGVRGAQCGNTSSIGASAIAALPQEPQDPSYTAAYFQCYDGYTETIGGDTSCKPISVWQKYAQEKCAKHCSTGVMQFERPSNDSVGSGAGGVSAKPVQSPYEAFMWAVNDLRQH